MNQKNNMKMVWAIMLFFLENSAIAHQVLSFGRRRPLGKRSILGIVLVQIRTASRQQDTAA